MTDYNDWTWWQNALQGNIGPVHDGEPQSGYYRMKANKSGRWIPVAIWRNGEGEWCGLMAESIEIDPRDVWTWVCMHPIQYDVYTRARTEGDFFDEPPFLQEAEYTGCHDLIDAICADIDREIQLYEECGTAANAPGWTRRVSKLVRRADDARKAEKQPFMDIGRAVDAKWTPIITKANDLLEKVKALKETEVV